MPRFFFRRCCVLLASAGAAYACWHFYPGSEADRVSFRTVCQGFANPPLFVTGQGSRAHPWSLRTLTERSRSEPKWSPAVVAIGDDPDRFFQSSPPSPIDIAVMLRNFRRLGANTLGIATLLDWKTPEPIALTAMERELATFERVVTSCPLSRVANPSAMPPSFRRASVAAADLSGDVSSLPRVNRLGFPDAILGSETAWSGFSHLESEAATSRPALLARWDDRIVFSFPLVAAMIRHRVAPEEMEIRIGEFIQLGASGPMVPIDDYGRLAIHPSRIPPLSETAADRLIDGTPELFAAAAKGPLLLIDRQSQSSPESLQASDRAIATLAALSSEAGLSPVKIYRRLANSWELAGLALCCLALAAASGLAGFSRLVSHGLLAAFLLASQWVAAALFQVWLPAAAGLAAVAASLIVLWLFWLLTPAGKQTKET